MSDYISRQAAIEALAGWKISPIVLDPVPAADVRENVRGEWQDYEDHEFIYHVCSICGYESVDQTEYCPKCGADMRGGKQ